MANMKYELHGNWSRGGPLKAASEWWFLLSTHRSREAAVKAAVKHGPDYRAFRIHTVQVENLPTSLTDPQRARREKEEEEKKWSKYPKW